MVVVAVWDTDSVRRLLITAGLTLAAWLLGAMLGAAAWADEPNSDASTGETSTTTHKEKQPEQESPKSSAPQREAAPAKRVAHRPAANIGLLGLLGNTVSGLLSTVEKTVGGLVSTVSTVGEAVLAPIAEELLPTPPIDEAPEPGEAPQPAAPATGGESVDVAAPVAEPISLPRTSQPAAPPDRPSAPPAPTERALSVTVKQAHVVLIGQHHVTDPRPATDYVIGGGEQSPGAPPSVPAGPICGVAIGHDNGGSGRQLYAVLVSSVNTTQLRLIGTGRGHIPGDAGRDAALPTTSPD